MKIETRRDWNEDFYGNKTKRETYSVWIEGSEKQLNQFEKHIQANFENYIPIIREYTNRDDIKSDFYTVLDFDLKEFKEIYKLFKKQL